MKALNSGFMFEFRWCVDPETLGKSSKFDLGPFLNQIGWQSKQINQTYVYLNRLVVMFKRDSHQIHNGIASQYK